MSTPMQHVFTLTLREGPFDGTFAGRDLLWDVYSEYDKAVEALKKEPLDQLGKEAKLWLVECYTVDEQHGFRDKYYFSLDGHLLDDPPLGPKFVPPVEPPPGRCQFVYICGMQKIEDLDTARCTKEGYHKEHLTKNNIDFDSNCQEHLSHFPHIWDYYHSNDPDVKAKAQEELKKLGLDCDMADHHPGEAS